MFGSNRAETFTRTKSVLHSLALIAALAMLATPPANAARLIPFQARLADAAGAPVSDGVYSITFAIYGVPLGGTALVSETHPGVSVIGGQVNVLLGAIQSLDAVDFSAPRYLGITVNDGSQEMVPRHELLPAFHARTAEVAEVADLATTVAAGSITQASLDAALQDQFVPAATVIYYDGSVCPAGWSELGSSQLNLFPTLEQILLLICRKD
jgi:hypothetical protein